MNHGSSGTAVPGQRTIGSVPKRFGLAAAPAQRAAKPQVAVTDITVRAVREPVGEREYVIVKIETDAGVSGVGEMAAGRIPRRPSAAYCDTSRCSSATTPWRRKRRARRSQARARLTRWPRSRPPSTWRCSTSAARSARPWCTRFPPEAGATRNKARAPSGEPDASAAGYLGCVGTSIGSFLSP